MATAVHCATVQERVVEDDRLTWSRGDQLYVQIRFRFIDLWLGKAVSIFTVIFPLALMRVGNNAETILSGIAVYRNPDFHSAGVIRCVPVTEIPEPFIRMQRT